MVRKKTIIRIPLMVLLLLGVFLIVDSLVLHLISFNYEYLGLEWIDPYIGHWVWGIICVMTSIVGLVENG